ncbi:MAG: hypothetical protein KKA26_03270, partial [Nanoarchaeota archaeon]|nr:hypothetical protein [Nanoarchaeota archaeon]
MHKDADSKEVVKSLKVVYKGFFDMSELYKEVKSWLDNKGYGDENEDFKEETYVERLKGESKQIEVKWICEKEASDYSKNQITITFFAVGLSEAEADWKGKKIKTNQGEIEINLSSNLITNASGKWDPNSLMKKMYEKLVVKDRIQNEM